MAPVGTLWGIPTQRQTRIILAATAVAGLELNIPPVEFNVTNKSPEYLGKFPFGKIPSFEDDKGLRLFEGNPIARYVCSLAPESGLLGKDAGEAALVDQWVHFGETEIAVLSYEIMALVGGHLGPYNKQMHDVLLVRQARALAFLDGHLAKSASGYLISDVMTLADIAIALVSQQAGKITCGAAERARYPSVFAHYDRVTGDARVKDVFGDDALVEEALAYKVKSA